MSCPSVRPESGRHCTNGEAAFPVPPKKEEECDTDVVAVSIACRVRPNISKLRATRIHSRRNYGSAPLIRNERRDNRRHFLFLMRGNRRLIACPVWMYADDRPISPLLS